jgi:hypothetical protein
LFNTGIDTRGADSPNKQQIANRAVHDRHRGQIGGVLFHVVQAQLVDGVATHGNHGNGYVLQ